VPKAKTESAFAISSATAIGRQRLSRANSFHGQSGRWNRNPALISLAYFLWKNTSQSVAKAAVNQSE
jgi:hypothetical protein